MSWPVIWRGEQPQSPRQIGDAWYVMSEEDWNSYYGGKIKYSAIYSRQFAEKYDGGVRRRPIMVQFPPYDFCIDAPWYSAENPNPERNGWAVFIVGELIVGQPAMITLAPSVGLGKGMCDYHGFLTNGVISDDLCQGKHMAAGDVTHGIRLGPGIVDLLLNGLYKPEPGDYWKQEGYGWMGCAPNGMLCNLSNHTVTETADGWKISVQPSIKVWSLQDESDQWHGYLENGEWREI